MLFAEFGATAVSWNRRARVVGRCGSGSGALFTCRAGTAPTHIERPYWRRSCPDGRSRGLVQQCALRALVERPELPLPWHSQRLSSRGGSRAVRRCRGMCDGCGRNGPGGLCCRVRQPERCDRFDRARGIQTAAHSLFLQEQTSHPHSSGAVFGSRTGLYAWMGAYSRFRARTAGHAMKFARRFV